ncbi:unnamed protein product, partial [Dovyalis caffra]
RVESTSGLLLHVILSPRPKTLNSTMISITKLPGSRSREHGFLGIERKQKLDDSNTSSSLDENWLKDTQNVGYWLKSPLHIEHSSKQLLGENMWLVHSLELP